MPQATSLFTDVESKVVGTTAVVIYSPSAKNAPLPGGGGRGLRQRRDALAHADPAKSRHAAIASGPSRSSEGFKLFYLVRWLD